MRTILLLLTLCLAAPAWAQLDYGNAPASPSAATVETNAKIQTVVKKTRGTETVVRPDWYGLFLLWAKASPSTVLSALRDNDTFENFASFMACDYVRDFRQNDVIWPQKQVAAVQKFNERTLNPQSRFRLLTYAVLGQYVRDQQQFVFRPLDNAAFSIKVPEDKAFGVEDDCTAIRAAPKTPWPREFILNFDNKDFIKSLPMDSLKAEYFLNGLPKDEKGNLDRRVVVEIEFDTAAFKPIDPKMQKSEQENPPVEVMITARRAIIYADSERRKELGRVGF